MLSSFSFNIGLLVFSFNLLIISLTLRTPMFASANAVDTFSSLTGMEVLITLTVSVEILPSLSATINLMILVPSEGECLKIKLLSFTS